MASQVTSDRATSGDSRLSKTPMCIPIGLQSLLSTVKTVNVVDTLDEVLEAIKVYIYQRKLFDSKNPRIIHCQNDELGKVLGVPEFSLFEIKRILLRQLLSENRANIPHFLAVVKGISGSKRKSSDFDNDRDKRHCDDSRDMLSPNTSTFSGYSGTRHFELERFASSDDDSSGGEEEVVVAKGDILAINEMYDVEYEIETESSSKTYSSFTDSDSDIEDILKFAAISEIARGESDEAFWADRSSDGCFDSDVEISKLDKWECKTCKSLNKPLMRYCLKCWEERSGWVMKKSERRVPPRSKSKTQKKKKSKACRVQNKDDGVSTEPSSSQDSSCSSHIKEEHSAEELCILCCSKPKTATIVHGKIGHQISCYRCARKLLSLRKPCPVCRRQIERVIHQVVI